MNAKNLQCFTVYHLNLAYSSIEEEQRPEVITKCYWPLLRLARKYNLPFGIEVPAYTLESIADIDPCWIDDLRDLITDGSCEFIGSGYSQLIGPIVPAEVNAANLQIGNKRYREILGVVPETAFVNEQAYSPGLIRHYLDAGYKSIIMEWENPFRFHREWNPEWRYHPQYACDQQGNRIPLIWNHSIAFQKFQRYAHGEMDLGEYLSYIAGHGKEPGRLFPLYGNDIEIFNFRPGRYHTEADLAYDEWERIRILFESLKENPSISFIPPRRVIDFLSEPGAGNSLQLESPQQPIPVKKQGKYNLSRWAVTGRNSVWANTSCWQLYSHYIRSACRDDAAWMELCYLWSSDFRTHITQKRWDAYTERLNGAIRQIGETPHPPINLSGSSLSGGGSGARASIHQTERFVSIETDRMMLKLNLRRGLTIESLTFRTLSEKPVVCTLPHGYYQDIQYGADFYSGHLVIESPGQTKITDLLPVDPHIEELEDAIRVQGIIATPSGRIRKTLVMPKDKEALELRYTFEDFTPPRGSFRLGHITLNPELLDAESLFYASCNGGFFRERQIIRRQPFDHGSPVSFLVSVSQGLGMTDGTILIGDAMRSLAIDADLSLSAPIGLVTYNNVDNRYFFRLGFSLGEMDETVKKGSQRTAVLPEFVIRIRPV